MKRMNEALLRIRSNTKIKIGLITEPPDFGFETEMSILRSRYNFVQIPSILGKNSIRPLFSEKYPDVFGDDDLESLKKLSILENYREIQLKVADFVLEQMAKVEIFGPTVYHLPVAPIDYSNYFDKVIILRQTEDFDHEHLKNHAEEEGFPPEVELELLKTQKIYFYELFERGIWKIKNK